MQKRFIFFLGCLISTTLCGHYYGPYATGVSDTVYATMMRQSIDSTKSLERTIAMRPHVSANTYYHQDYSTRMRFGGDNKGAITIAHGGGGRPGLVTSSPNPVVAGNAQKSWWKSCMDWIGGGETEGEQSGGVLGNKRQLTYKALALGYAYLNFRLFRSATYLQEKERWFLWRQEVPLADLIAQPQAEVAAALVAEIRQRYGQEQKQTDAANPFGLFMKALEEEDAVLRKYQTLSTILLKVDDLEHRCLRMCCEYMPKVYGISLSYFMTCLAAKIRVKTFFYLDDALLQATPERLARVAYLKSIFSDWLASHKVLMAKGSLYQGVVRLRAVNRLSHLGIL